MAYAPVSPGNILAIYLTQWLKTASGGRVHLAQRGSMGVKSFYVFKCDACKDNWHVGGENFIDSAHIPKVLIDWVQLHRHVCTKYTNTHGVTQGTCSMCSWPYGAHEQSWWNKPDGLPSNPGNEGTVYPPKDEYSNWSKPSPSGHSAHKEKPLQIFKGRKFRDPEEA